METWWYYLKSNLLIAIYLHDGQLSELSVLVEIIEWNRLIHSVRFAG